MTPLDEIPLPPDLASRAGKAWMVHLDAAYAAVGKQRSEGAEVASWIVEAQWAHPAWHSYWIALSHLRPVPDARVETKFYLPGATHELLVFALDPNKNRLESIQTGLIHVLSPANFAAQFIAANDAAAMERVETSVMEIVTGALSPDSDWISVWAARYGDNMLKKPTDNHV